MQLEEVDDDFMRPTEAIKTIANDYADYQARKLSGLLGLFSPVSESVYGLLQKFGVDPYADIEVGPKDPWYIITSRNLHAGKEGTLARSVNDFIASVIISIIAELRMLISSSASFVNLMSFSCFSLLSKIKDT